MNMVKYIIICLLSLAVFILPAAADNPEDIGYVHTSFALEKAGYDTAGGNDPDENYFHTEAGIERRSDEGVLLETILLPDQNIFGVASDGENLYCANYGSKIYRYLGAGNGWTGGLDISESGARGLAVSDDYFFLVAQDGVNIAVLDKTDGHIVNKFDISAILGEGLGLGYVTDSGEVVVTNGTDYLYCLKFSQDMSSIDSISTIRSSASDTLFGAGYNSHSGDFILNDTEVNGQYATGPSLEVRINTNMDGSTYEYILINDSRGIDVESFDIPGEGITEITHISPGFVAFYDANGVTVEPIDANYPVAPGQTVTVEINSLYPIYEKKLACIHTTGIDTTAEVDSPVAPQYSADLDCDGDVDTGDLFIFVTSWLTDASANIADIYKDDDNIINFLDFAAFATQWLITEQ